jgi:alpha-1,2-mannosyltransferase
MKGMPSFRSLPDRLRASAKPWELGVFVWIPGLALTYSFWWELRSASPVQDFGIFRLAAEAVLHGRSPFPPATAAGVAGFDKFVYPPSTALLFAPLAGLPLRVAQVVMLVLAVACVVAALRLLGVGDWRCYGVAVMSAPAVNSLALGAVTPLLLVGVAAGWRYRERAGISGLVTGVTTVGKLFLWPVGLWLLATRRLLATLVAVAFAAGLVLVGWAVIGFAGFRSYPHLLRELARAEEGTSYSPVALFGLSGSSAGLLTAALAASVILAVFLGSRGHDGDRRGLTLAVIGSLVATPIVWLHYFLLLLVPIGLYRPRLSPLWFAPVLLWLTPAAHSHGVTWHIALALGITALVAVRTTAERQTRWLLAWTGAIRAVRAGA